MPLSRTNRKHFTNNIEESNGATARHPSRTPTENWYVVRNRTENSRVDENAEWLERHTDTNSTTYIFARRALKTFFLLNKLN